MTDELHNQIERYLFKEMSEKEEQDFIARMDGDSSLKEEVELIAMIIVSTRKAGQTEDLSDIKMLKQASAEEISNIPVREPIEQVSTKKYNSGLKIFYWVAAGAAVVLLIFGINHIMINNTSDKLFTEYYVPLEKKKSFSDITKLRGSFVLSERDSLFISEGMNLYENKMYAKALSKFNEISDDYYSNEVSVFKAVCLLEIEQYFKASVLLETAVSNNSKKWEFYQDAQWYLALSYYKTKRLKEAKNVLEIIISEKGIYAKRAEEMLNK